MRERQFFRALGLTAAHEARLLRHDPVALLMMLFAPVVIITVAGYSLGALYGSDRPMTTVAVVDRDGGEMLAALRKERDPDSRLQLEPQSDLEAVRRRILQSGNAPLAIEVPAGTRQQLIAGKTAQLVLYVDPARRLAVNALELELGVLERRAAARLRARTQRELLLNVREVRHQLRQLNTAIRRQRRALRRGLADAERETMATVQTRVKALLEHAKRETEAALLAAQVQASDDLRGQLASRVAALEKVKDYLEKIGAARQSWQRWLSDLQVLAGSHAAKIPVPEFPDAPPEADLAVLGQPIRLPAMQLALPAVLPNGVSTAALALSTKVDERFAASLPQLHAGAPPTLPGALDIVEQPAVEGTTVRVNAFDQYVPGFGVTFLLIGMMMGVALTLYDEHEWGTLERLQAAGASLGGILVGKALARVVVGTIQMVVLFGIGWLLFGISLGHSPVALLLPMLGMAIAGAALGLLVSSIATAHDSVMPLGTMISLALSAIGGCWWPLDFEPAWMRTIAHGLPTTWTMQAFNDLMIRGAPPSAAIGPFLITTLIGCGLLTVGVAAAMRRQG